LGLDLDLGYLDLGYLGLGYLDLGYPEHLDPSSSFGGALVLEHAGFGLGFLGQLDFEQAIHVELGQNLLVPERCVEQLLDPPIHLEQALGDLGLFFW